jgi:hypothetical protein
MNTYIYELRKNNPVEEGVSQDITVKVVRAKDRTEADGFLRQAGYGRFLDDTYGKPYSIMVVVEDDTRVGVLY